MKNRKKAFTLIELIVGLSIQLIIMSIGIKGVIISFKEYNYHKEIAVEDDKIDEAILTIRRYINGNMIDEIHIDENKNEISIVERVNHIKGGSKTKKIKFDNVKRVTLETYEGEDTKPIGVNIVLRDAEKFDIVKKGNLYYLTLKTTKGEERIICL